MALLLPWETTPPIACEEDYELIFWSPPIHERFASLLVFAQNAAPEYRPVPPRSTPSNPPNFDPATTDNAAKRIVKSDPYVKLRLSRRSVTYGFFMGIPSKSMPPLLSPQALSAFRACRI
jgi:hypothetical protein